MEERTLFDWLDSYEYRMGHLEMLEHYVFDIPNDINSINGDGDTPLIYACMTHPQDRPPLDAQLQTVQAIITAGGNVNAVNNNHETALWKATSDGNFQLVRLLLKMEQLLIYLI